MGMLTGPEIAEEVARGRIHIDPFCAKQCNSNSYNMRLSDQLLIYDMRDTSPGDDVRPRVIDMAKEHPTISLTIPPEGLVLRPGCLYLGATIETAGSDHYIPMVEGRSSVGRLGCAIHCCAGFGDQGFSGNAEFAATWTLEIVVTHPLRIYAGVEIAQIAFHEATGAPKLYRGKYTKQIGPRPSGLWKEFQRIKPHTAPGA